MLEHHYEDVRIIAIYIFILIPSKSMTNVLLIN